MLKGITTGKKYLIYGICVLNMFCLHSFCNLKVNAVTNVPTIKLNQNIDYATNKNVVITITCEDDIGLASLETPDNIVKSINGTSNTSTYTVSENGRYRFTVTNMSNQSSTQEITVNNIDKVKPELTLIPNITEVTNQSVVIDVRASDNVAIEKIILPNKQEIFDSTAEFEVIENGAYSVQVYDTAGNVTTEIIEISNIDKTEPGLTLIASTTKPTNKNISISAVLTDNKSLKTLENPDGTVINVEGTNVVKVFSVNNNGQYSFTVTDLAGNRTTKTIDISNIDKISPEVILTPDNTEITNGTVSIYVTLQDNVGLSEIIKPDNEKVVCSGKNFSTVYQVSSNGTYNFTVKDLAGNIVTSAVTINNIDNIPPGIILTPNTTSSTNKPVNITVTLTDNVELKEIVLPDNSRRSFSGKTEVVVYSVDTNGTFIFVVTDKAGNEETKSIVVNNIDKELPVINLSTETIDSQNVKIKAEISDNDVIAFVKLPSGEVRTENISEIEYIVSENDVYEFVAEDMAGNRSTNSIAVFPKVIEDNWVNREVARQLDIPYTSITNTGYKTIVSLNKNSCDLTGELPVEMLKLTNLQSLDISDNQLIGNVPSELKSKFGSDSFKNNLFNNMSNQKYLEMI